MATVTCAIECGLCKGARDVDVAAAISATQALRPAGVEMCTLPSFRSTNLATQADPFLDNETTLWILLEHISRLLAADTLLGFAGPATETPGPRRAYLDSFHRSRPSHSRRGLLRAKIH